MYAYEIFYDKDENGIMWLNVENEECLEIFRILKANAPEVIEKLLKSAEENCVKECILRVKYEKKFYEKFEL